MVAIAPEAGAPPYLSGSFSLFSLSEVCSLLGTHHCTGAFHIGRADGQLSLWVDDGHVVGVTDPGALVDQVVAIGALTGGWFQFESEPVSSTEGERVSFKAFVTQLDERQREWDAVVLPFDALVKMASVSPDADITIRSQDWKLLSTLGSEGQPVSAVIEASDHTPFETLQSLRALIDRRLVTLEGGGPDFDPPNDDVAPPPATPPPPPPPPPHHGAKAPSAPPRLTVIAPVREPVREPVTAVLSGVVMPPPISGDPWSLTIDGDSVEEALR
jgi:hypothetical protein